MALNNNNTKQTDRVQVKLFHHAGGCPTSWVPQLQKNTDNSKLKGLDNRGQDPQTVQRTVASIKVPRCFPLWIFLLTKASRMRQLMGLLKTVACLTELNCLTASKIGICPSATGTFALDLCQSGLGSVCRRYSLSNHPPFTISGIITNSVNH